MADFTKQFNTNHRLTTAEIVYHMPDHPRLLQTFLWQDYDLVPRYPRLNRFLDLWNRTLDGKIHSVYIASHRLITPGEARFYQAEFTLQ